MTLDLKAKYAGQWATGNARELLAVAWLSALGLEPKAVGHGTLSSKVLGGFHHDALDKFDFFDPGIPAFFEVTGTSWSKRQSAKRFKAPVIPVLKSKVDYAFYYGMEGFLWFVAVAECQGEIRFLPCRLVLQFPRGHYARGEGEYYLVPWDYWWPPFRALPSFAKRRLEA